MTDKEVCAALPEFPTPCPDHPHGIRIERSVGEIIVYCNPCLYTLGIFAPMGVGRTETLAIRDWNGLVRS